MNRCFQFLNQQFSQALLSGLVLILDFKFKFLYKYREAYPFYIERPALMVCFCYK